MLLRDSLLLFMSPSVDAEEEQDTLSNCLISFHRAMDNQHLVCLCRLSPSWLHFLIQICGAPLHIGSSLAKAALMLLKVGNNIRSRELG
jgi:hypothetical protein